MQVPPVARTYTKKRRAASEEQTRQRIVESAIAIHQQEGGNSTISAIADRAGVGRVTVYRHFPDELALITACTSHYMGLNPPPDLESWASIDNSVERLRHGLAETYAYHRQTEAMMTVAEREVAANPVLADLMKPLEEYWAAAQRILAAGWSDGQDTPPLVEESIGLAISLPAWRILTGQQGLSDSECVSLFVTSISNLATRAGAE